MYSDLVRYQTSDIKLLWTTITQTINPPPHPPLWCSTPTHPQWKMPPPFGPFASASTPPHTHECFLALGSMENDSEKIPRLVLSIFV